MKWRLLGIAFLLLSILGVTAIVLTPESQPIEGILLGVLGGVGIIMIKEKGLL